MIIVNNLRNESIVGTVNGKNFSVSFNKDKYEAMKAIQLKSTKVETIEELQALVNEFEPLTHESYKEVVETLCPFILVNNNTNQFYLQYNGVVSSKTLPASFAGKIIDSIDKGVTDIDPIIKCWARFLRNPNYTDKKAQLFSDYITAMYTDRAVVDTLMREEGLSLEVATRKATTNQVAISMEGLIVGYKVSREIFTKYALDEDENVVTKSRYTKTVDPDTGVVVMATPDTVEGRLFEPYCQGTSGDAFYCGDKLGHHIRVGQLHYLENWDQVDCNDSHTAVKGLHMGGLSYISGFSNGSEAVTHNILVDPMHIGAVVGLGYGNDGAMRVKQYFVHSSLAGVNKNIYHSSTYASITDKEYGNMLKKITEETALKGAELEKLQKEAIALSK